MSSIILHNLQKVIEHKTVLNIPALEINAGEIVGLVGPVGSGKDTLFELLTGQMQPTAGTVRLAGIDPASDRKRFSRCVGVLFAGNRLYERCSAADNLQFQRRLYGLPKTRVKEVLGLVGLADHAHVSAGKLSSSLARRLALGRALLHAPSVFVLVEPFAKCDTATITLLIRLMQRLADGGAALLILSDDAPHLDMLCGTVHVLDQGRIIETYHPDEERHAEIPFKIPVQLEGKVTLVNPADVLYAAAEAGAILLYTVEQTFPTQFTLNELEERLSRSGFFRAHRSYLVNLQRVKDVIPYTRNSFSLCLDDEANTEIPLSKSAARELRELLDY